MIASPLIDRHLLGQAVMYSVVFGLGIEDLFDEITIGTRTVPALLAAIEAPGSAPDRTIVVIATASGVAAEREAGAGLVIALARGFSSPEDLRQAGAHTVVADLQELLRAVT
jgi:beta-phosphoglucomutase-like phosphatase (HAD superfamily)